MVRLLRESGADIKPYWVHAKAQVKAYPSNGASIGCDAIFRYLLSSDPSFPVVNAFRIAIRFGFIQSLKFIVETGADIDTMICGDETPICYAIRWSSPLYVMPNLQLDVVSYLIQEGASLKDSDNEPLKFSGRICRENPDLATLLLRNGACVDHFLGLVEELFEEDNDENFEKAFRCVCSTEPCPALFEDPCFGHFSLIELSRRGEYEMVKLILGAGADVNEPAHAQRGRTTLQKAAEVGSLDIVDFLLQHDANANASPASWRGVTALQAAAINSQFDIARRLLERGADPNAPRAEKEGRTALEGTAERGRIDMLQLLLDNGVDIKSAAFGDEQFRRAVELAEGEGYHAAARLLKRYRDGES